MIALEHKLLKKKASKPKRRKNVIHIHKSDDGIHVQFADNVVVSLLPMFGEITNDEIKRMAWEKRLEYGE